MLKKVSQTFAVLIQVFEEQTLPWSSCPISDQDKAECKLPTVLEDCACVPVRSALYATTFFIAYVSISAAPHKYYTSLSPNEPNGYTRMFIVRIDIVYRWALHRAFVEFCGSVAPNVHGCSCYMSGTRYVMQRPPLKVALSKYMEPTLWYAHVTVNITRNWADNTNILYAHRHRPIRRLPGGYHSELRSVVFAPRHGSYTGDEFAYYPCVLWSLSLFTLSPRPCALSLTVSSSSLSHLVCVWNVSNTGVCL